MFVLFALNTQDLMGILFSWIFSPLLSSAYYLSKLLVLKIFCHEIVVPHDLRFAATFSAI
jgi:hypothetical protein